MHLPKLTVHGRLGWLLFAFFVLWPTGFGAAIAVVVLAGWTPAGLVGAAVGVLSFVGQRFVFELVDIEIRRKTPEEKILGGGDW